MIPRTRVLLIGAFASLFLFGCEKQYRTYSKIEVITGVFHTPKGEFDAELVSDVIPSQESKRYRQHRDNFTFYATDGITSIKFAAVPDLVSNQLVYDFSFGKTVEIKSILYTMDDTPFPVSIDDRAGMSNFMSDNLTQRQILLQQKSKGRRTEAFNFRVRFPKPLTETAHKVDPETYARISNQIHRFRFNFLLNDQPYSLDVKYRKVLVREAFYGTPYGGVSP